MPDKQYRPTQGDQPGNTYTNDPRIHNYVKSLLEMGMLHKDNISYASEALKTQGLPSALAPKFGDISLEKSGDWKLSRGKDDKGQYISLFNYNPVGSSYYDRYYDTELTAPSYSQEEKKIVLRDSKTGAIRPHYTEDFQQDGWQIGNQRALPSEPKSRKQFVDNWFHSSGAKNRFVKSGQGDADDWNRVLDGIDENLNQLHVAQAPKIPDLWSGEWIMGEYTPRQHAVVNYIGDQYTHEITHGTRIARNKAINQYINKVVSQGKILKTDADTSYMISPEEIYSRIMNIREKAKFNPNQTITKEALDKFKAQNEALGKFEAQSEEWLFKYLDSDTILKLLNTLASNKQSINNTRIG